MGDCSDDDEEYLLLEMPKAKPRPAQSIRNGGWVKTGAVEGTTRQAGQTMDDDTNEQSEEDDDDLIFLSETQLQGKRSMKRQICATSLRNANNLDQQCHEKNATHAQDVQDSPSSSSQSQHVPTDHTEKAKPKEPPPGTRPSFLITTEQQKVGPLLLSHGEQVPTNINRFLRQYQREGVRFFHRCYREQRGCLLGDDMGLGKTIQVIAFLAAVMRKSGMQSDDEARRITAMREDRIPSGKQKANAVWASSLIICPASVQTNWQNELDTWGYFEHALLSEESLKDFARGRLDILISSHELASRWIDKLNEVDFTVIVVDECHKVKNPQSAMTQAFGSLACRMRIGLSGTIIQNRFEEMWTILNWCSSGRFLSMEDWKEQVIDPIKSGQAGNATESQIASARIAADRLHHDVLPTWFLRRTKDIIKAQLPLKRDNIVFCPLTETQIAVYKQILDEPEARLIRFAYHPCDCGVVDEDGRPFQRGNCCYTTTPDGQPWYRSILKYLHVLQACSNHVALVFPDPQDDIDVHARSSLSDIDRKRRFDRQVTIVKRLFPRDWRLKLSNRRNGFLEQYCGKWLILRDLMRVWKKEGDKLLLFSMNLRLLDWIASFVELEGFDYVRLDGSTPQKKRQALVDQFNQDRNIFCFLISTTAGGAGLNLTGANRVVIFDPHWNPAHDLQAMDRAYRFGQTRNVDVYRLIGRGSLEEAIYDRQLYKQQLGKIGYEASHERRFFKIGAERGLDGLFTLREGHATRELIQECDVLEAAQAAVPLASGIEDVRARPLAKDDESSAEVEDNQASPSRSSKRARQKSSTDLSDFALSQKSQLPVPLDPIQALLFRQGVKYTHRNDDLLGGSAAESLISKRALERHARDARTDTDLSAHATTQTSRRKRRSTDGSASDGEKKRKNKESIERGKGKDTQPRPQWPPIRRPPKAG